MGTAKNIKSGQFQVMPSYLGSRVILALLYTMKQQSLWSEKSQHVEDVLHDSASPQGSLDS